MDIYDSKPRLDSKVPGTSTLATAQPKLHLAQEAVIHSSNQAGVTNIQLPDLETGTADTDMPAIVPAPGPSDSIDKNTEVAQQSAAGQESCFSWQQYVEELMAAVKQDQALHAGYADQDRRPSSSSGQAGFVEDELKRLQAAAATDVLYISARLSSRACEGSWLLKRILVDNLYAYLLTFGQVPSFSVNQSRHVLEVVVPVCL